MRGNCRAFNIDYCRSSITIRTCRSSVRSRATHRTSLSDDDSMCARSIRRLSEVASSVFSTKRAMPGSRGSFAAPMRTRGRKFTRDYKKRINRECRPIKDAFHLVTQVDTNIVLSLLFIECQER